MGRFYKIAFLTAVVGVGVLYLGGILILWRAATLAGRPVEASHPSPALPSSPAVSAPVARVPARAKPAASTPSPAAPGKQTKTRVPDRTDFGPTNYNPWTDEPPRSD